MSREVIRREYPLHPIASTHAVVLEGDSVLLVQRAHEPSSGWWSAPGGVIELGETVFDAVRREVREECGIEIRPHQVIDVVDNIIVDADGIPRFHFVIIYVLAQLLAGEVRANSDAQAVRWVTRDELNSMQVVPALRSVVEQTFLLAHKQDRR
jgi:8-oxo-dGTP diphosphatase